MAASPKAGVMSKASETRPQRFSPGRPLAGRQDQPLAGQAVGPLSTIPGNERRAPLRPGGPLAVAEEILADQGLVAFLG
jgi:hypothetical protein